MGIEQRFNAEAVPRQKQFPPLSIIDGEGKHAVQMFDAIGAPLLVSGEDDFGVAIGPERYIARRQFLAKLPEVVDFSVEADHQSLACRMHRLRRSLHIDD